MSEEPSVSPTVEAARAARAAAREVGFDAVGVAALEDLRESDEGVRYRAWIAEGRHGDMGYLATGSDRRQFPGDVLAGARSILMVALNHGDPAGGDSDGAGSGVVARYARGRDYHPIFTGRLKSLEARLHELFPGVATRRYVDTGPVLEKLWAERAGLGWRGKHTNLVSRSHGSWLLLGEILLDRDLAPDEPEGDHCGTCTRCIDVCPTRAITAPYELDARLCVSYLTIEHRGSIPRELRSGIGNRVFGCDDCLAVCPWNRFAREAAEADFRPRPSAVGPLLAELVEIDDREFYDRFAGTPLTRAKRAGLARNACVALGNTGSSDFVPVLARVLDGDPSPVVREHAAWALGRIGGPDALGVLRSRGDETDLTVLREISLALGE